jgi:RHS repeat-associated protein
MHDLGSFSDTIIRLMNQQYMKRLSKQVFVLLLIIAMTAANVVQAQTVPEAVKVDRLGRSLPKVEQQFLWSNLVIDQQKNVFPAPPCLDGQYYVGFQLYYDLGDKKTTANWNAHLDIALMNGSTTVWTKPVEVQMNNQNFISTIFHDVSVACTDNYTFAVKTKTLTGTVPVSNIYLKVVLFKKHLDDFDAAAAVTLSCSNANGQTSLGWSYAGNSALEYDVEWVFIADYENFTGSTAAQAFAFKAAAGVTTAAIYYNHATYYPVGRIWYRVRAVGYKDLYPEHRILGQWFYSPSAAITLTNQQADITWQGQTIFAEDGKYKKVVSYYDGSLRQRQVLTNLSTNNVTLVGETLYDFEGRESVNFLPSPSTASALTFKTIFNTFASQDGTVTANTSSFRKKFHYDNGTTLNSKASDVQGTGNYYSPSNAQGGTLRDYIPNADGYVYSQKEYLQDSKGLVSRQSGVGEAFSSDGSHVSRTYYGQAARAEIVRLFGSNVGNASHYKKNLVVDNNGQISVAYLDQEGRTIATALAGDPPANVNALQSYLDLAPYAAVTVDVSDKNKKDNTASLTVHKILNGTPNTSYTFNYSMSALSAQVTGFGCNGCTYDLTISVTDPDGKPISLSGAAGNQAQSGDLTYKRYAIATSGTNCSAVTNVNDISITLSLAEIGDYTITKSLVPRPLSFDYVKSQVEGNGNYQTLRDNLMNSYTVNTTECATCNSVPACPEAAASLDDAVPELASLDCQNIYNSIVQELKTNNGNPDYVPTPTEISNHAKKCKYDLCVTNIQSDVFEKQIARFAGWNAAVAGGMMNIINLDPFFNVAGLSGLSAKSTMQSMINDVSLGTAGYDNNNDNAQDGTNTFHGTIFVVTDPANTAYYVNNRGMIDPTGFHILYWDLMNRKDELGTTEYNKQLDALRWTMFRNFYLDAKRKTKIGISAYQNCASAKAELQITDNLPLSDIAGYGASNYATGPVTQEEVDGVIWQITDKCKIVLSAADNSAISQRLHAYFDINVNDYSLHNYMRLIFSSDVASNPDLIAVQNILNAYSCALMGIAKSSARIDNNWGDVLGNNLIVNAGFTPGTYPCGAQDALQKGKGANLNTGCFSGWSDVSGTPNVLPGGAGDLLFWSRNCDSGTEAAMGTLKVKLDPTKTYQLCLKYRVFYDPSLGHSKTSNDHLLIQLSRSTTKNSSGSCRIAGPSSADLVTIQGSSTNELWRKNNFTNTDYVEECVIFTPTQQSQYIFITAWADQAVVNAATIKDLRIQEVGGWGIVQQSCIDRATDEKNNLIEIAKGLLLEDQMSKFYAAYQCLSTVTETLNYSFSSKEYHYTLYYYDQAGNLIQTIAPKGVVPLTGAQVQSGGVNPSHTQPTIYRYNSYNQLSWQQTPDAGITESWYNSKAQLRLSRNAQQILGTKFSYSKYDAFGRVTEAGELTSPMAVSAIPAAIDDPTFPLQASNTLSDITWNFYDAPDPTIQAQFTQENLRNRVSYTEVTDASAVAGAATNVRTYFSYDIHGNVKSIWQSLPGFTPKRIDYQYDLVSNKVNYVFYQFGTTDQFVHKYSYDADNRITGVYTSTDRFIWNKDAGYDYYKHGPLARTELGEYRVQGLDYYYTLQGWIKGVNMPYAGDPGGDGVSTSVVGKDAAAYTLGYYQNDYKPINASVVQADTRDQLWQRLQTQMGHSGLYNGNISWMITDLLKQGDLASDRTKGMQAMLYKYDQLHRIRLSQSLTSYSVSGFATRTGSPAPYDETFTYDPNGNILTLKRWNETAAVGADYNYQYYAGTNKLLGLNPLTQDLNATSGQLPTDNNVYRNITVSGTAFVGAGTNVQLRALNNITFSPDFNVASGGSLDAFIVAEGGNYRYDAIGNLLEDQEKQVKITWTPQGKVRTVDVQNGTAVTSYRYDGMGNRIEKKVVQSGTTVTTRYLRDASGSIMSVYSDNTLIEQPLYGSSRLGQYNGGAQEGKLILGLRRYELNNHLGNVLSVVTDKVGMDTGTVFATVESTNDYYPFGLAMAGRTWKDPASNYRYGFNGKEKDSFNATVYDYGFRIYNPEIARFLSVDPLTKSYPWYTPYQFAGNMPISAIDLDGLEPVTATTPSSPLTRQLATQAADNARSGGSVARPNSSTAIRYAEDQFGRGVLLNKPIFRVVINPGLPAVSEEEYNRSLPATIQMQGTVTTFNSYDQYLKQYSILRSTVGGPSSDPFSKGRSEPFEYYYRAMSLNEYNSTGGYLKDLRTTGEGPHVRKDLSYITNASFIQNSNQYDIVVRYRVRLAVSKLFDTTPYVFQPGSGPGKPIFDAARNSNFWYKKLEKGESYGFPGNSTNFFNLGIIDTPEMIQSIRK